MLHSKVFLWLRDTQVGHIGAPSNLCQNKTKAWGVQLVSCLKKQLPRPIFPPWAGKGLLLWTNSSLCITHTITALLCSHLSLALSFLTFSLFSLIATKLSSFTHLRYFLWTTSFSFLCSPVSSIIHWAFLCVDPGACSWPVCHENTEHQSFSGNIMCQ